MAPAISKFFIALALSSTIVIYLTNNNCLYAQSAADDVSTEKEETTTVSSDRSADLFTERVEKIGETKKILIVTNTNKKLGKGDFITILLNEKRVVRALVAKVTPEDDKAGIKLLKVYSLKNFSRIRTGLEIQMLKGDDTQFGAEKVEKKEDKKDIAISSIEGEDDLYKEESSFLNGEMEENKNRAIKPDNLFGASWGKYGATDIAGGTASFSHWGAHWAYQMADNIWGEVFYAQSSMPDYPVGGLDTSLTDLVLRFKYCISAPFYSYVLPYIGYQMVTAKSPQAGQASTDLPAGSPQLEQESNLVNGLNENKIVFGVTIMRRLVPGWFAKADLGMDVMNVGLALEF